MSTPTIPDLAAIHESLRTCPAPGQCPFGCDEMQTLLDYTEALMAAVQREQDWLRTHDWTYPLHAPDL